MASAATEPSPSSPPTTRLLEPEQPRPAARHGLPPPSTFWGTLVLAWGLLGPAALICSAIARLLPVALQPLLEWSLTPAQFALYCGSILFNGYAEGYRGFQKGFAPRVVGRAFHLAQRPTVLHGVLAPLYAIGFVHSSMRRKIVSTCLTVMIVLAVVLVRRLDQPWRGIVDAGVVVGLIWGMVVYAALAVRGIRGRLVVGRLDLPGR